MKTLLLFLFVLATLCFGTERAQAAYTCTWIGSTSLTTSSNWRTASNSYWNCSQSGSRYNNTYPGNLAATDIVAFNTNAYLTLTGALPSTYIDQINVTNNSTVYLSISSGVTLPVNTSINVAAGSTLVISSGGVVEIYSGGTCTNSGTFTFNASTLLLDGASATNSAVFTNSGTANFTNSSTCNLYTYATVNNNSGATLNLTSSTMSLQSGSDMNNTGTFNSTSSNIGLTGSSGNYAVLTNNGTESLISSALTFNAYAELLNTGSGATTTATSSTFTLSGAGTSTSNNSYILNSTGGVFNSTSCLYSLTGAYSAVTSSATMAFVSSSINASGASAAVNNTSSMNFSSSAVNLSGSASNLSNSSSLVMNTSNITASGASSLISNSGGTITFSGTASSPATITLSGAPSFLNNNNASTFNASYTTFALSAASTSYSGSGSSPSAYINNSGTFNAATDGSTCTFNLSGYNYITNGVTSSSYTDIFSMGPQVVVNLAGYSYMQNSAGTFTLESNATGSAMVGQITSGAPLALQGVFNVQRFMTGGSSAYRAYRLMATPVVTASGGSTISLAYVNVSQTVPGTFYGALTGGPGGTSNGFSVTNNNPTLYIYNDSKASSNSTFVSGKNVGITKISGTTLTTLSGTTTGSATLTNGNGYLLYFIGNNNSTVTTSSRVPENTTITATGYLSYGNITVSPWNTGTTSLYYSSTASAGYNMMGNPYACTIDLSKVYTDNGSLYPVFYELDDYSHSYVSYNASSGATSSSRASQYVASGQGFFVKATAASQTLTFKEDQKVTTKQLTTSSTPYLVLSARMPATTDAIQSNAASSYLHLKMQRDSVVYDECGIYFKNGWSDKFDSNDSYDIDGASPKVYLSSYTSDSIRTCINALADYTKGKNIRLYVKSAASGLYKLQLEDMANIDTSVYNVILKDNYIKDSLDIGHYGTYNFNVTSSDSSSFGGGRFVLSIVRKSLPAYQLISFTAAKATNGVLLTWKTYNEGDYTGFAVEKQDDSQFAPLYTRQSDGSTVYTFVDTHPLTGTNIYRLKQNDINDKTTYSPTISISYNGTATGNAFSVYPNPAKEAITVNMNLATTNGASSTYEVRIYNSLGVQVLRKAMNGNNWSQDVTQLAPGIYSLEVSSSNGTPIGKSKFLKVQ